MTLLEREPFLTDLATLLQGASAGQGHIVFLGGEAGVGKTTLVKEFCRRVEQTARVALGACDPLSTPRPLGPLLDVAETLSGLGTLEQEGSRDKLFRNLLNNLTTNSQTTLLIFEDVHWADEATLDLLRFLGRRMGSTKALLIATYRDDEVGAKHPLRILLGDLATSSAVRRMALPPLSENAVTHLAEGSGLDAAKLHQQTGGNPFFVTEILAAKSEAIPATVRDAVLARVARLSPSSRAVLEAASVIGARVESWLLTKVAGAEISAVEDLLESGMLFVQNDGFAFRHELARQAVLGTIPPHRQTVLHTLVLETLKTSPSQDLARLAHHAEEANNAEAVLEYAPKAALRAAGLKAHREAAAQYARALRFAEGLGPKDKANLLESYALECNLTGQLARAIAAHQTAIELWQQLGDSLKEGESLARLSIPLSNSGRNSESEAASRAAIAILESLPPSPPLAAAYRVQSSLRMVNRDNAEAITWAKKAMGLAEHFQDVETLALCYNFIGAAMLVSGDAVGGREQLEHSLNLALEAGLDVVVSNAYTNLGTGAGEVYEFALADHYLALGIAYSTEHDFDSSYFYAWQALSHMYQGRWNQAAETALTVLRYEIPTIARIMALLALGRLRARRGDPETSEALDEALALASGTGTLQRLAPVCAARAEAAWLAGDVQQVLREAHTAYDLALSKGHAWFVGELAYWQWKVDDLQQVPSEVAQPFALQMAGKWREAAQAWQELNCPYEVARALSESGDEIALKEALDIFENLGTRPMAQWVSRRLRDSGVKGIPRGPRSTTKTNPAGLTTRELEVLHLLAEGQRDKQIARNLNLSEKTVGHHVSAILAKLAKKSRAEAVLEATRLGILTN
jgi:DNA-binding CsgD family transcriptional regulator